MKDKKNPEFAFQTMDTELLLKFASGEVDAMKMIKKEIANRGLNKDGEYVGFRQAEKVWRIK